MSSVLREGKSQYRLSGRVKLAELTPPLPQRGLTSFHPLNCNPIQGEER